MTIKIYCLEGCHGTGKTEVCKKLSKNGYNIVNEDFLQMEDSIKPQSLLAETIWLTNWFQKIIKLKNGLYVTDRSPYSAAIYSDSEFESLKNITTEIISNLENVEICIIHIKSKPEILWKRVQDRLKLEPERKKYNEGSKQWLLEKINIYDGMDIFDKEIENNDDIENTCINVMKYIYTTFLI